MQVTAMKPVIKSSQRIQYDMHACSSNTDALSYFGTNAAKGPSAICKCALPTLTHCPASESMHQMQQDSRLLEAWLATRMMAQVPTK